MPETTTVRIDQATCERLRRAEERLGISTIDAVRRAVDALDASLFWDDVERYYEAHPGLPDEDRQWVDGVQRAQS